MASEIKNDSKVTLNASVDETITQTTTTKTVEKKVSDTSLKSSSAVPGSFQSNTYGLPDWYNVGWTAFSELPNPGDEAALEALKVADASEDALYQRYNTARPDKQPSNTDLISQFLSEAYYGEWYHNAGVMIFAVASTWLQTKLGGGLMGCLVIGAFLGTYYQSSIRRFRRNVRDDIQREMMATKLLTDIESADWINNFMKRFWLIYEPGLSAQIISTADAILVESTPSFLDSIRLSTFTLGNKGPRIEGIKTYPRTEPNVVCMDWKVSFIPNDNTDLTQQELESKVNPKIILTIRLGKGMLGAGMPILLEDIAFSGTMRLKFKLYHEFPHIKTIEASFLEPPHIDYSLKPVGGETFGFDINNIPGLEPFIKDQIHATLGPMMYAPNVYTVDMTGNTTSIDDANGVVAITLYSGSNLKAADLFGSLDPFVTFHIGNTSNAPVSETKALEDTTSPTWNETHFVLINNLNESIFLQVMDKNTGRKDTQVGVACVELKELENENFLQGLNLTVLRNSKPVGELKADIRYLPVSKPVKKEDGTIEPPPETDSGILRFNVHGCGQLGGERKGGFGLIKSDISAYSIITVNGKEKLRTKPFKRSVTPTWNKYVDVFVTDKKKLDLGVTIMDANEFVDDTVIGKWTSGLVPFQEAVLTKGQDWWNLTEGAGRIHLSMTWKPIVTTGVLSEITGATGYSPPIGVVRVKLFGARDLKNVEALTGGKSDPYARILSGTQVRGKTDYIDDDLNPEWNTALYIPVHTIREDLLIEVMDYNDIQKDKSLGVTDIILKDLIKETKLENGQSIYDGLEAVDRDVELKNLERTKVYGKLHYAASFHPTLELAMKEEEKEKEATEDDIEKEATETVIGEQTTTTATETITTTTTTTTTTTETTESGEKTTVGELPEADIHGEKIIYTEDKKINLNSYESGILSVNIQNVAIANNRARTVVDVLVDSNDAQYTTATLKGSDLPYHETADAFVKEIDFSQVILNVRRWTDNEKEYEIIGTYKCFVRDIVRQIMNGEHDPEIGKEFKLLDCENGTIRLGFKYTPVIQFKLDPAESLENQGNLTVTAIKASNLKAADRSGNSDPFVVFTVDGEKVHKTEVIKKNLNPVFKNETFTAPVKNRCYSVLKASVYDWDQFGSDTLIGEANIPFSGEQLESFAAKEFEIPLTESGTIRVRLLWQPQLLARKRTGTSLFSATTRIFTSAPGAAFGAGKNVAGAGIGAGGKVLGAGASVIGAGANVFESGFRGIGKLGGIGGSKKEIAPPVPPVPSASTISSQSGSTTTETNGASETSINNEDFSSKILQIDLVEARGLKAMDRGGTSDPFARVRMGNKQVFKTKHIKKNLTPQWNEDFKTKAEDGKIDIKVKDKNTLSDVDIGGVVFDATKVLQTGQSFDGWLTLEPANTGEIHIRVAVL
ncbi:C2 domain-containing protein [Cunninghamella echinulata]|nr:C2 domain-containing protein [Cunninghamella echinulata]